MASLLTITDNLKPWLRRINLQSRRKTRNLTFLIKLFSGLNSKLYSGASRAARGAAHGRCPIGKKMWQSTHPRKFGNHVTVHRPTDRPTDRPPDLECDRRCLLFFGCTIRLSIRCKTFHSKLTSPFPHKVTWMSRISSFRKKSFQFTCFKWEGSEICKLCLILLRFTLLIHCCDYIVI